MDQDDNLNIDTKDVQHAIRIGERVWWVGHYMPDDTFQCHVYLIEHGDHSVLIDPGGYLTFKHVYKKVQEVVPFSNIRYFICQHQDPDITAALRLIDIMPDVRKDAVIVTHWRTMQLIKHYDPALPFWNIDEHNWQLDLGGGRVLKFIFTPYLHFPAAFCTFDTLSGILFSSDIFGGFTANWSLVARDQSHIENIRPFHEHYMPSREILIHGLSKLEEYPIKMIAPQHGSIIPSHLIDFMIDELKQTDCGLYALARDSTDIHRLSFLNKALKDITNVVVTHRDFWDIANELLAILRKTLPVSSAEFYAYTHNHNKECLCLMPETRFRGIITAPPVQYESMSNLNKRSWLSQNKGCYKKMPLPPEHISDVKKAIGMFLDEHVSVPVLGIVENMAWFTPAKHPEERYFLFGQGGGENLSGSFKIPLLAQIPINETICDSCDGGRLNELFNDKDVKMGFDNLLKGIVHERERLASLN